MNLDPIQNPRNTNPRKDHACANTELGVSDRITTVQNQEYSRKRHRFDGIIEMIRWNDQNHRTIGADAHNWRIWVDEN